MPVFSLKQARAFKKDKIYGAAVANYMSVLKYRPDKAVLFEKEFFDCFKHFCTELETGGQIGEANDYFIALADVFPNSGRFFCLWGEFMLRHGLYEEAALCFLKTLSFEEETASDGKTAEKAGLALNDLRDQLVDQWHFRMLNDYRRNKCYETAIKQSLNGFTGATVLDLGCGTGILSMIAATSGAKTVYACEHSAIMAHVAKNVLTTNGLSDQIILFEKNSFSLQPDVDINSNSVNVVVTELMDAGFFGENIIGALLDAKMRFLAEGGIIVPGKVHIYVALIECRQIRDENFVQSPSEFFGFVKLNASLNTILSSNSSSATNLSEPYDSVMLNKVKCGFRYLSKPTVILTADLNDLSDLQRLKKGAKFEFSPVIIAEGRLDAIVSWFKVDLVDGVTLSTDPSVETSWEQAVFPIASECFIKISDELKFNAEICENWFRITKVNNNNDDNLIRSSNASSILNASSNIITSLNDSITSNSFRLFLESYCRSTTKIRVRHVIDVSGEPILSFLAAKLFDSVVKTVQEDENLIVVQRLLNDNPEFVDKIRIFTRKTLDDDDERTDSVEKIDILICNPIDWTSGLLKPNGLEDIIYYKVKYGPEAVFPGRIDVCAVLVESEEFVDYGRISNHEKTLDYRIKDALNVFVPEFLREIEYSTACFKILTEKRRIFSLNFNESLNSSPSSSPSSVDGGEDGGGFVIPDVLFQFGKHEFAVIDDGRADALIFWYEFGCPECDLNISTIDESNRFKTAAFILKNSFEIFKNDVVTVAATLDRSKFKFNVNKKQ